MPPSDQVMASVGLQAALAQDLHFTNQFAIIEDD